MNSLKKIASILLILIVLLQCSTKLAIVCWYNLNKEFIAANLCENKAKPKMKCSGKCQLSKKIKESEKAESKLPDLLKQITEVPIMLHNHDFELQESRFYFLVKSGNCQFSFHYISLLRGSIFQPPKQYLS